MDCLQCVVRWDTGVASSCCQHPLALSVNYKRCRNKLAFRNCSFHRCLRSICIIIFICCRCVFIFVVVAMWSSRGVFWSSLRILARVFRGTRCLSGQSGSKDKCSTVRSSLVYSCISVVWAVAWLHRSVFRSRLDRKSPSGRPRYVLKVQILVMLLFKEIAFLLFP